MLLNYINDINENQRIIVIGDIHGDIKRFKTILKDCMIINDNFEWIAEPSNTIIIQLGDQIDSSNRLTDEKWEILKDYEMIYFTEHLNNIARVKGGFCISLIGNHELMNIIGDFSYVSDNSLSNERRELFKPKTGSLALILARRPLVIKIKDLMFSHAKIEKSHLEILKKNNKDIFYINYIWKNFLENNRVALEDKEIFDNIILGSNGILWNRANNNKNETEILFKELGITYLFLGHTALDHISIFDNQIWYCDTGISRAFGTQKYQYIDINRNLINVKTINDN